MRRTGSIKRLGRRLDTDPRITDADDQLFAISRVDIQHHFALVRELDGVLQQVGEDLGVARAVAEYQGRHFITDGNFQRPGFQRSIETRIVDR